MEASKWPLTNTMANHGKITLNRRAHSIPDISGIRMSIRTTRAFTNPKPASADSPDEKDPTQRSSSEHSRMYFDATRTCGLSSTIATGIFVGRGIHSFRKTACRKAAAAFIYQLCKHADVGKT